MPQRFVVVPESVTLKSSGGEGVEVSFRDFVTNLMNNPMWGESFSNVRAQAAIMRAVDAGEKILALAEEDWRLLKSAVESPKQLSATKQGVQVIPGYGVHPSVAYQLLPLACAIVDAKDRLD
jgi:hypothetical protein